MIILAGGTTSYYSYQVLQKYINSAGQVYNYGYNENLRLESITTPKNILAVKNIYDSANRSVKTNNAG